jgi:hypothetical protein
MPMNPRTLRPGSTFTPRSISGLALWLDAADTSSLYTTDAGPVTPVTAPTEISGCVGWWDASDAASITQSGGLVSQWNDKSGLNNHATASGSARPTLTAGGLNGRSVMTFDGTANAMTVAANAAFNSNDLTYFVVFRQTSTANKGIYTKLNADGTSLGFGLAVRSVSPLVWLLQKNAAGPPALQSSVDPTTATRIYTVTSTTTATGFLDGLSSVAATGQTASHSLNQAVTLGARASSEYLNGFIAEIIHFNTALSPADRARVEAYLAAKWGISGVHAQATATNDPVGYWRDKSGNNRHATQATGASRAAVASVALNGRKSIGFDGTDDSLELPALDITPATVLGVVRHSTGTSAAARTPFALSEGGSYLHAQFIQSGASQMVALTHNAARASYIANGVDVLGASFLLSSSQSASGGGTVGRLNGTDLPYSAAIQDSGGANRIGCRYRNSANDQFWNGQVAEFLVYQSALSSSQITRLERYLAAKWGITLAPQVSNADAQDWVNRVYANGGTVSSTTASAVNTFCNAIEAAGIRDRFYRLNLFCGTGLTACLVPLYRGQSLGGTQGGHTADSNIGPFVTGDYAESAGLTSDGISKHLRIGTLSSVFQGIPATGHMSVWSGPNSQSNKRAMGVFDLAVQAGQSYPMSYNLQRSAGNSAFGRPVLAPLPVSTSVMLTINRASTTSVTLYQNTTIAGSSTTESINRDIPGADITVFGASYYNWTNNSFAHGYEVPAATYSSYSCGLSLTASQLSDYYNALVAFRTAMGRT